MRADFNNAVEFVAVSFKACRFVNFVCRVVTCVSVSFGMYVGTPCKRRIIFAKCSNF